MGLGSVLSYLPCYDRIFGKTEIRVLILGLSGGVGKTTVLYNLINDTTASFMHTVAFNVKKFDVNNLTLEFMDFGGGDKMMPMWTHYYSRAKAIIFVIDSTDRNRLHIVVEELNRVLNEKDIEKAPLLVLANKQDLPTSMSIEELKTALNLDSWKNRSILLQPAVATEGTGLKEGMDWLCAEIQNNLNK